MSKCPSDDKIPLCLKEDESFLQHHFIHHQNYEFIPLHKGGCSENYILKTYPTAVFIKKPHGNARQASQSIVRHLNLVQNAHLVAPKVLGQSPNHTVILELIKGKSVPSHKITLKHLNQLWPEYQKIKKIPTHQIKNRLFFDLISFYDLYLKKIQTNSQKNSWIRRYLWHIILNAFTGFPKSEIVYRPKKVQTIHGDFHNNNILFDNNKLTGILDWEEMTIGYACQDWVRYTFCLIERLSNYYQRRKKTKMVLSFLLSKKTFSKDEWALAFDNVLIQKMFKIANDQNLSFFRLLKTILFVRFWQQEKTWVLNQVKK